MSGNISAVSLVQLLTTDLVAISRGRSMASDDVTTWQTQGVGWVPGNLALDPFDTIATPNARAQNASVSSAQPARNTMTPMIRWNQPQPCTERLKA